MSFLKVAFFAVLVLSITVVPPVSGQSIVQQLKGARLALIKQKAFRIFLTYFNEASANKDLSFLGKGSYTILAPTDKAIEAFQNTTKVATYKTVLGLVRFHIIIGKHTFVQLTKMPVNSTFPTALKRPIYRSESVYKSVVHFRVKPTKAMTVADISTIVTDDIYVGPLITIQGVNKVLMPV